jgi:hypothetical protein
MSKFNRQKSKTVFGYYQSIYSKDVLLSQKESFLEKMADRADGLDFISDDTFNELLIEFNISEDIAMEWMVEDDNFHRLELEEGWRVANAKKYEY